MQSILTLIQKFAAYFARSVTQRFSPGKVASQPVYTVMVDDNYHHGDESERYTFGTFPTLEAAVQACKQILDEYLEEISKDPQPSGDALYKHYVAFGPDPFIATQDPSVPVVPFSAWGYAREQCFRRFGEPAAPELSRGWRP